MPTIPDQLEQMLVSPYSVQRLDGGYSWRTYAVRDASGRELILRVAPEGGTLEPYDPEIERRALDRVAGLVPAPEVVLTGPRFLVETAAPGRVLRPREVPEPGQRRLYRDAFARTLGRVHRLVETVTIGEALRGELGRMRDQYESFALRRYPGFEHGLQWLERRLPTDPRSARFCHGDYRFSNIAWTAPGLVGAVLDWERSGPGDPLADVAFSRLYSGWCSIDGSRVRVYEQASGCGVDEDRVAYLSRFERLRSYTASMRGHRAFAEGRSDDVRLKEIGEAGERGMEEVLTWR